MDIHIVQTRFFAGVLCALLTASCTYNIRVAAPDDDIRIVLVPAIESFDYELEFGREVQPRVLIVYSLTILRYDGFSFTMTIPGEYGVDEGYTVRPGPIWSFAENCIRAALRNAATNMLFKFHGVAGSDDWLAELEKAEAGRGRS